MSTHPTALDIVGGAAVVGGNAAAGVDLVRVVAAAEETFGSREKAGTWLRRPTIALAGESPLDLLDTDEGAREVETLLGRVAHGIAA